MEKKVDGTFHARPALEVGPLLEGVLRAQCTDEKATAYPRLASYCAALEAVFLQTGASIVWPIGPAAERLAGAATLFSEGRIRLSGWSDRLDGERVLLLAVAAVTPVALGSAAEHVRALGALEVHACGVAVQGADDPAFRDGIAGYVQLEPAADHRDLAPTRDVLTPIGLQLQ